MPRPTSFVRCVLLTVWACIPAAHAAHMHRAPREIKREVAALEQQWRTATLTGDTAMMDRLLSDDYVGISWTGQINTKATQMDRVRSHSLMLTRLDLSDAKVKVFGSVAVVTSRARIEGSSAGAPMDGTYRYTRVYQRLAGGTWKITNFEATRIHGNGATPDDSQP